MESVAGNTPEKKKPKPEWRVAAESYMRDEDGSKIRLSSLGPDDQARALGLLVARMSRNHPLSAADAEELSRVLTTPPRQFAISLGAAMLGGSDEQVAKRFLKDGIAALETEPLHEQLSRAISPRRRMEVLKSADSQLTSDAGRGALLDLVASWLRDRLDGQSWPTSPQDAPALVGILERTCRELLLRNRSEGFWKSYIDSVPPRTLADSGRWRELVAEIAARGGAGNHSQKTRDRLASYLREFHEGRAGSDILEPTEQQCSDKVTVKPSDLAAESPQDQGDSATSPKEDRAGFLARLRAARVGIGKLHEALEEAETEHERLRETRSDLERARRELESAERRGEVLGAECEKQRRKCEERDTQLRARDQRAAQLEASARAEREEKNRFRDLVLEGEMSLNAVKKRVGELEENLLSVRTQLDTAIKERDAARNETDRIRLDRERLASQYTADLAAARDRAEDSVRSEVKKRVDNILGLEWEAAYRIASDDRQKKSLEELKHQVHQLVQGG